MHRRLVLFAGAGVVWPLRAAPATLTIFAAASLQSVLPGVLAATRGVPPLRFSFAASSTLARQIEHGAPADVFVSADEAWMDHLERLGRVEPASRRVVAANRLVVVRPGGAAGAPAATLRAALAGARVATGDPAHVPVGRYAEAALRALGLWSEIAPKLVRADNVRTALAFVERGEADAGIVYATDAALSERVHVAAEVPASSHPPIRYPAARVTGASAGAQAVIDALLAPAARAAWQRAGFDTPG